MTHTLRSPARVESATMAKWCGLTVYFPWLTALLLAAFVTLTILAVVHKESFMFLIAIPVALTVVGVQVCGFSRQRRMEIKQQAQQLASKLAGALGYPDENPGSSSSLCGGGRVSQAQYSVRGVV